MTIPDLLAHPYSSAAVAVLTTVVVALLRWRFPERWAALPKRVQVLPVLLVAAILSATKGGVQAALLATQEIGVELIPFLSQWATDSVLGWLGSMGTQQAAKRALPAGAPPSEPPGVIARISERSPGAGLGGAAIVLMAMGLTACAGTFEEARKPSLKLGAAPPSPRCVQLDDRVAFYGGVAKGSAVLAGAAAPVVLLTDDQTIQVTAAVGGAVFGAAAAGAGLVSESAATSWARECGTP